MVFKKQKRVPTPNKLSLKLFVFALVVTLFAFAAFNVEVVSSQPRPQSSAPAMADEKRALLGEALIIAENDNQRARAEKILSSRNLPTDRQFQVGPDKTFFSVDRSRLNLLLSAPELALSGLEVQPNHQYEMQYEPNDPQLGRQWAFENIQAKKAWDIARGSTEATVAIIDSGALFEHAIYSGTVTQPDFPAERLWTNTGETGQTELGDDCWGGVAEDKTTNNCDDDGNGKIDDWQGWDFMGGFAENTDCPNYDPNAGEYVDEDNDPNPYSCDNPNDPSLLNKDHYEGGCSFNISSGGACSIGHGTSVASVAAAATNNSELVAGVDHNAKIMNLRIFDGYGVTSTSQIAAAIYYATDNGADVINLSLGLTDCSITSDDVLEDSLVYAAEAGVISVAASGNDGDDNVCYPGSSEHTIAVGSSDQNDKRSSFSSYGPKLDMIAPGEAVLTATAPSNYLDSYAATYNGTSFSAPHVAGTVSLIEGAYPGITAADVIKLYPKFTDDVPDMQGAQTKEHGHGRLNLYKTLKYATSLHPDGLLVSAKSSPHVYVLEDGKKRRISSPVVFANNAYKWSEIKTATLEDIAVTSSSRLSFREGTLLKGDSNKIYVIDHSNGDVRKRHITSPSVFTGLGYTSGDVLKVKDRELPSDNGPAVKNFSVHPDGTLVRNANNGKVFLLENSQKRHIISLPVFSSHGFSWDKVKKATSDDLSLSNGPRVHFREGTLVKGNDHPIYLVDYNNGQVEKRHIKTLFIYKLLDFNSSKLYKISESALPNSNGAAIR